MPGSARAALIVDDAPELRITLRWMLGQAGYDHVEEVDTGEAAIAAAGGRPFHVAVVDFSLPGADGAEVAREILRVQPQCCVAGFTASRDAVVEDAFMDAGVMTFFEKTQLAELVDWAARVG
jgi:DNA-binding NtrC family response regulator